MLIRIVSLISLSDSLLLVYRHKTDFCILILHPAASPNSLMSCIIFLVASPGFSRQEYRSGLPYPPPDYISDPGIEPASLSPALTGGFFIPSSTWEA